MGRFRYESVLRYRKFEEEKLQQELCETKRELEAEKTRLGRLEKQLQEARHSFRLSIQKPVSSPVLLMHNRFLEQLGSKIARQLERIEEAQERWRQKRAEVVEAQKNRKSLEKVKQNHRLAERAVENRLEGKFLDEIGVNRFIHRQLDEDN